MCRGVVEGAGLCKGLAPVTGDFAPAKGATQGVEVERRLLAQGVQSVLGVTGTNCIMCKVVERS